MATAKKTSKAPKSLIPVRQPVSKPVAARKVAAKPPRTRAVPTVAAPLLVKAAVADKPKKPKLIRDSFSIPKAEYSVLKNLKQRAGKDGIAAKKSEILRAGIKALAAMGDAAFAAALAAVPALNNGRSGSSELQDNRSPATTR